MGASGVNTHPHVHRTALVQGRDPKRHVLQSHVSQQSPCYGAEPPARRQVVIQDPQIPSPKPFRLSLNRGTSLSTSYRKTGSHFSGSTLATTLGRQACCNAPAQMRRNVHNETPAATVISRNARPHGECVSRCQDNSTDHASWTKRNDACLTHASGLERYRAPAFSNSCCFCASVMGPAPAYWTALFEL